MKTFEVKKSYRFRSAEERGAFIDLIGLNRKVAAAIGSYAEVFTVLSVNECGSADSIMVSSSGKIITPSTLGFDIDVVISYDEIMYFEEVEISSVEEKKYDVMTAQIGGGQGFLIRHIGVSYEEAERWASEYVKEYDDQYAYIIQRHAKVELKMEPAIKIEKL